MTDCTELGIHSEKYQNWKINIGETKLFKQRLRLDMEMRKFQQLGWQKFLENDGKIVYSLGGSFRSVTLTKIL